MTLRPLLLVIALASEALVAEAVEVRFTPDDCILSMATNREAGYSDLVVHSIVVATGPGERFHVDSLSLVLQAGSETLVRKEVPPSRLIADTAGLASHPVPALVAAQLSHDGGASGLFDRPVRFATGAVLSENSVLVTTRHHFSLDRQPDTLVVLVAGRGAEGGSTPIEARLPICPPLRAVEYTLPLRGPWWMNAAPGIQSHHRLTPPTEFAVDFYKVAGGRIREGDPARAESYFGYGEEVLAAADGEVVRVIADVTSDRATRLAHREGDPAGFFAGYLEALRRDALRGAAGNVVVLRHDGPEGPEFSTYAHLMEGSVRVALGQRVARGKVIGRVGDTGELVEPHLHFQINDGPAPLLDKSLPATFTDVEPGSDDLGRLVEARPPASP